MSRRRSQASRRSFKRLALPTSRALPQVWSRKPPHKMPAPISSFGSAQMCCDLHDNLLSPAPRLDPAIADHLYESFSTAASTRGIVVDDMPLGRARREPEEI